MYADDQFWDIVIIGSRSHYVIYFYHSDSCLESVRGQFSIALGMS
jgi:hypothetical protein